MNYKRGILMKVHLVCALMGAAMLQSKADVYGQLINLNEKDLSFKELIHKIESQSNYRFVYEDELIRTLKAHNVNFDKKSVRDVLNASIGDLPIRYEIVDNTIILKRGDNQQQMKEYVGFVFDNNGFPLQSATVRVRGTFRASATDAKGRFSISLLPGEKYIEISLIGFHTKELNVNSNLSHIVLEPVEYNIDETVVSVNTGYRALTDAQLTGAVSTLNQKDYDQRVAVSGNFLENLEGKMAGLVYNPQSGDLSIRGVSTFDAVRKPLIVLDGFPTEIDIQSINPNDIVSINVLKDAAAASIYGSRASNGVIVIETKRGKLGGTKFNLRATSGIQSRPNFDYMNYANSSALVSILKDNLLNESDAIRRNYTGRLMASTPVHNAVFDFKEGKITREVLDSRVEAVANFDNLDQYKKLFYRPALTNQIDFDLSGGSDKNTYLLGANFLTERGQYVGTDGKRILLNFASTHKLNRLMDLDFKAIYRNGQSNSPYKQVGVNDFYSFERLVDENGIALPMIMGPGRSRFLSVIPDNNEWNIQHGLYDQLYSPYADVFRATNKENSSSIRFQARLNTKINSWLSLDLGGAYENESINVNSLQQENYFSIRRFMNYYASKDPSTEFAQFSRMPKGDWLTRNTNEVLSYTARGQFNINKVSESGDHQIAGVVGSEIRRIKNSLFLNTIFGYDGQSLIQRPIDYVSLRDFNFTTDMAFRNTLPATSQPYFNYNTYFDEMIDDRRFVSFYADGTYLYKNKYALTGSIRTDQSNLFGTDPKYRYKPFYSIGANWSMHQEDFMKELTWVNLLKLRTAYGVNGNTPTSANGQYLILQAGNNYYYDDSIFYDVISPQNTSMRWERTSTWNIGADFAVLNSKLSGSLDYYHKYSTDVIGLLGSDPTSGFNSYNANTASIVNNGFEMQLSSINVQKDFFKWLTQLTGSFNFNKVKNVATAQPTGDAALTPLISQVSYVANRPIGALYAYNYAGLNDKGQPEIYDHNGVRRMVSTAGNDEVTIDDMLYMGTTVPKYVLGLNNQFSLGQFDLSFLFMYYGGHVMRTQAPDPYVTDRSFMAEALNYWAKPGDEAVTDIPGFMIQNTPGYFNAYAKTGYTYANKFVKNADFIRLRDIVLTYRLKEDFSRRLNLSNTMIRFQVQNPWKYTFSDNSIDPDAINPSTGLRSLPRPAMYSISLYTNF